jgi:hypothetical protein
LTESLLNLLHETYRELRPRAPLPEFDLQFYPFANLNNTIRLSNGRMRVRLSDLLESAPEPVLRAIVHILLAKIYRKPIDAGHTSIIISKVFDQPHVPRYAMEYIVYHEMLHLKHPIRMHGSRRCVHGKEFREDERAFPQLEQARNFLKTL